MYTDEDLNLATRQGIFTETSVSQFRELMANAKHSPAVDEENFKLVGGFNDIFVVIACALLLFSSLWALGADTAVGFAVFAGLSWALAEFFVAKRKMALPAIMLLGAFVGGVFFFTSALFTELSQEGVIAATTLSSIAAFFHWKRFRVPITIAVGTATALGIVVSSTLYFFPKAIDVLMGLLFVAGLLSFSLAMIWDASDTKRITYKSDVAFWLHLLSAPLIIHPVFSSLGILAGNESVLSLTVVIVLYLVMTSISLAVDRRAFMVSSLVYVIYALSSLIETLGGVGYSFALTGVVIGAALLFLSAFWHPARSVLVSRLPKNIQTLLPSID